MSAQRVSRASAAPRSRATTARLVARLADPRDPALLPAWQALAGAALEPNPFFEPAALVPAVELLPGGEAVRLLVVEAAGQLLLALPVHPARYRRLPVSALSSWQHAHCYSGTALLSPDRPVETWTAALELLRSRPREHLLVLPRTPVEGPVAVALDAALASRGWRADRTDVFDRPALHRRAEPTYLDGRLGPRSRKALRRHGRRLSAALGGELALTDVALDPGGLSAAVTRFLDLERAGWKGAAGTAMDCDPAAAAYLRRVCAAYAAAGRLQLWSLGVPGRPAAVQLNLLAGDTVFHWKTAYDEALAPCSPGLQLEVAMVEEFHRDTRLGRLDSCTDPGPTVSDRLYPDRLPLATLLVPTDRLGTAVARSAPTLLAGTRRARARLRRADRERPA